MDDIRGSVRRYLPLIVTVVVLAATGVAGATLLSQPDGEAILDNVEQRYESAETTVGTVELVAANDTDRYTATVEYAAADGNRSRVTVTADNRTIVTGSNNSTAWAYNPATGLTRTATAAELRERGEQARERFEQEYGSYESLRDRYGENVSVERTGTATVGGERTYVLELRSTNESITATGQLWVDTEGWTVRKATATDENGTVTARFVDTRFNVSVHESTWRPPTDGGRAVAGAERTAYDSLGAAQNATSLSVPDLRGDYDLSRVVAAEYNGTTTVTAAYETPNGTAYVARSTADRVPDGGDSRTVADREVTVASARGGAAVYWSEGNVTTAVVVRGPVDSAVAVAGDLLS